MNKTRWSVLLVLIVMVLGFLLVFPVGAQETTGQDTAAEQTGQQPSQAPSILSLTLGELIGIVFGAGAPMVGIGKILWDGNQPGQPTIDQRLTQRVDTAAADREWIERLEKAYALGGLQAKTAVDALAGVLTNIAPLTGIKVDDAALRLLKDIQTPGSPNAVDPFPSPQTDAGPARPN